uniref:Secreted protein n=1 Tax=Knipowitschia caucasica TaxID=637954 RepID=A0AAV2MFA2_KNICA
MSSMILCALCWALREARQSWHFLDPPIKNKWRKNQEAFGGFEEGKNSRFTRTLPNVTATHQWNLRVRRRLTYKQNRAMRVCPIYNKGKQTAKPTLEADQDRKPTHWPSGSVKLFAYPEHITCRNDLAPSRPEHQLTNSTNLRLLWNWTQRMHPIFHLGN